MCEIARRHGLSPQQLFGWRRRLRDAEAASCGISGWAFEFVPAVVEAGSACGRIPIEGADNGAETIEVEIGDVKIRIGRGADGPRHSRWYCGR